MSTFALRLVHSEAGKFQTKDDDETMTENSCDGKSVKTFSAKKVDQLSLEEKMNRLAKI